MQIGVGILNFRYKNEVEEINMYKSYKYRLLPNEKQKQCIDSIFKALHQLRVLYAQDYKEDKKIASINVRMLLSKYSKKDVNINKCDESAVCHELFLLKDEKDAVLSLSTRIRQSYTTSYFRYYRGEENVLTDTHVFLPTVGYVKYINSRSIITYKMKSFIVSKDYDNKYYLTIVALCEAVNNNNSLDIKNSIGLDYSSKYFIVDNNGTRLSCFHSFRDNKEKLNKLEAKLGKLKKEGDKKKYAKELRKYFKLHRKISNKRNDFLHKTSTSIIKKYDYIFVEDLDLADMKRKYNLTLATIDNAYAKFIKMLEYKAKENNKKFIKVERYFPSSKKCSNCSYINNNLTLDMRSWTCPKCGVTHDRDTNSAINIRNRGIEKIAFSYRADSLR